MNLEVSLERAAGPNPSIPHSKYLLSKWNVELTDQITNGSDNDWPQNAKECGFENFFLPPTFTLETLFIHSLESPSSMGWSGGRVSKPLLYCVVLCGHW